MIPITVKLSVQTNIEQGKLTVASNNVDFSIKSSTPINIFENPLYEGSYIVTPATTVQTLYTAGYRLDRDIQVNPIPSNYGLITWDGRTITVS